MDKFSLAITNSCPTYELPAFPKLMSVVIVDQIWPSTYTLTELVVEVTADLWTRVFRII